MTIEVRQTKRAVVYRVVVASGDTGSERLAKTFRTRAAAEAWERETLSELERRAREAAAPGAPAD